MKALFALLIPSSLLIAFLYPGTPPLAAQALAPAKHVARTAPVGPRPAPADWPARGGTSSRLQAALDAPVAAGRRLGVRELESEPETVRSTEEERSLAAFVGPWLTADPRRGRRARPAAGAANENDRAVNALAGLVAAAEGARADRPDSKAAATTSALLFAIGPSIDASKPASPVASRETDAETATQTTSPALQVRAWTRELGWPAGDARHAHLVRWLDARERLDERVLNDPHLPQHRRAAAFNALADAQRSALVRSLGVDAAKRLEARLELVRMNPADGRLYSVDVSGAALAPLATGREADCP